MDFKYALPFPYLSKKQSVDSTLLFYDNFKDKISYFYIGLPSLDLYNNQIDYDYEEKCDEFLRLTYGLYKRVLYISPSVAMFGKRPLLEYLIDNVFPVIEKYSFDGVYCWNFNMAVYVHEHYPGISIYLYPGISVKPLSMKFWKAYGGVSGFSITGDMFLDDDFINSVIGCEYSCIITLNEKCSICCRLQNKIGEYADRYGFCKNCSFNNLKGFIPPVVWHERNNGLFVGFISGYMKDFCWNRKVFLNYLRGFTIGSSDFIIAANNS